MKVRLVIPALFGVVLLVAACGPTAQLRNDKFLDDSSFLELEGDCTAPCWRGITPGTTPWSDALTLIEDDPTLEELETNRAEDSEVVGAIWKQADGETCCQMYTETGDIVDVLVLQTAPQTTLGQLIEARGDPTYLIGEAVSDDQAVMTLIYPDIPMLVYAFVEGENGALSATSEIIGFGYFAAERMELLLQTSELHDWDGYKLFSEYVDSPFEVTPSITLTPTPEQD